MNCFQWISKDSGLRVPLLQHLKMFATSMWLLTPDKKSIVVQIAFPYRSGFISLELLLRLFAFAFRKFNCDVSCMDFFGFTSLLVSVGLCHLPNLRDFQPLFL